ncbi:MAG: hypothetical protein KDE33_13680 [Bacteroidetes bacterium]|nr:hypothetical protein [Bacteroidota bacterium]
MDAEFEEKEYEFPLNSQLLWGNQNIWTPGQVFEGNFGIDAALEVHRQDFWDMVGYPFPLEGVVLSDFKFGYVWRRLNRQRPLPTFKLNLFIQTKRPEILKNRPSNLKALGLGSPYWRFEIKNHQQTLLHQLKLKLNRRAFVAYACAAFGKHSELYHHTQNKTLVENSTFVKVEKMDTHHKWIYDAPGSSGIAMSDPELIEETPLFREIESVAENFEVENDNPSDNLRLISNAINEICQELQDDNIFAREIYRRYRYSSDRIRSSYLRQFVNVANFSLLSNTQWFVIK